MYAKKLNKHNFQNEILNNANIALVDFYADWCGPCRMMGPIVDEIASERPDVTVGKVNLDENPELASKYRIMTIPTLLVFKNGDILTQASGLRSKEDILEMLE